MIIKLEKKEELTGYIWFLIWVDNICIKSFGGQYTTDIKADEENASKFYQDTLKRAKEGYPKKETILSETIESTQP